MNLTRLALVATVFLMLAGPATADNHPQVRLETTKGRIELLPPRQSKTF